MTGRDNRASHRGGHTGDRQMREFVRATYDCEVPPKRVRTALGDDRDLGTPATDDDGTLRWERVHQWGFYRNTLRYSPDDGSLTLAWFVRPSIRYLVVALVGLLIVGVTASNVVLLNLTSFVGVFLVLLFYELTGAPTVPFASVQSYHVAWDYYLVLAVLFAIFVFVLRRRAAR